MMRLLILLLALPFFAPAQMQMGMRGKGKPLYYPQQLDSLFYWFKADEGVFDSLGNVVTTDDVGIAEWRDFSGNNYHVTQTTNTARPVYKTTGGPGSKPTIQFDGTNDFLASAAHLWESDDLTIFVVMKFGNATRDASEAIINKNDFALNQRQWSFQGLPNILNTEYEEDAIRFSASNEGSTNRNADDGLKSVSYGVISILHDGTSNGTSIYVNSASQGITRYGAANGTIYNFSQPLNIGYTTSNGTPIQFLFGSISEIIVYSRALSTVERIGVEQYLNAKYQLY